MPTCPSCGATNRGGARHCYQCSTPLVPPRPSVDDQDWLAATLAASSASPPPSPGATQPLATRAVEGAPPKDEGAAMNQQQQPDPEQTMPVFAGRYAIVS